MPEYIAHASIDENGKIAGGKAGDQTKKRFASAHGTTKTGGMFYMAVLELIHGKLF